MYAYCSTFADIQEITEEASSLFNDMLNQFPTVLATRNKYFEKVTMDVSRMATLMDRLCSTGNEYEELAQGGKLNNYGTNMHYSH